MILRPWAIGSLVLLIPVALPFACTAAPQGARFCEEGTPGCEGPDRSPTSPTTTIPTTEPTNTGGNPPPTPPRPRDAGADADAGDGGPPKGPNCLSGPGACIHVQLKCGCAEDCCSGLVCGQTLSLSYPSCCMQIGTPCGAHRDCCGALLCRDNDAGG